MPLMFNLNIDFETHIKTLLEIAGATSVVKTEDIIVIKSE